MLRAVSKFGGSSVADAACVSRVVSLIKAPPADRTRQHVVVSAPGKRTLPGGAADIKVTDLLLKAHGLAAAKSRAEYDATMSTIAARFMELCPGLASLQAGLDAAARDIYDHGELDTGFAASRGEYLNGLVVAHETGMEFVNPAEDFIIFGEDRKLDAARTLEAVRRRVACQPGAPGFVIPGFFGGVGGKATPQMVATMSRGGSDVTASLVAAALATDLQTSAHDPGAGDFGGVVHENFTDVDGVYSTDPRLCPTAKSMPNLSYAQTHALALAGAGVLHPDAVTPLVSLGVPIHVRSTWDAEGKGTWISTKAAEGEEVAALPSAATTEASVLALGRATALAVAGSGSRVTVVCKEVAEPGLGRRAVESRLAAALTARGLAFTQPKGEEGGLGVAIDIGDAAQLNAAVEAIFDDLLKPN